MKNSIKKKGIVVSLLMLMIIRSLIPSISGEKNNVDTLFINVSQSDDNVKISYQINNFEKNPVEIEGSTFYSISISEEPNLLIQGMPDLPVICRSVIIPDNAKMSIKITDCSYVDYEGVRYCSF